MLHVPETCVEIETVTMHVKKCSKNKPVRELSDEDAHGNSKVWRLTHNIINMDLQKYLLQKKSQYTVSAI